MKVRDFIFETFMRLTSKTVPYGYEDRFVSDVMTLLFPDDIQKDNHGNYFYEIGNSRTIFASHIDTVSKDYTNVGRVIDGDIIRTDGKTTLGADDKAGMTVMLWMIKNKIPGLYYFFIGEEVGCIGSGLAAKYENIKGNYDRVISFDRRGTDSIITFQSSGRCCSDKFADALSNELNKSNMSYKKDTGGVYTDSAEFVDLVSECTNISVGYYKEHTTNEHQDIKHLEKLAVACIKVDWENLPVERDPSKTEYKSYTSYGWGTTWDDDYVDSRTKSYSTYDDFHDVDNYGSRGKRNRRSKKGRGRTYFDNGGTLHDITSNLNKLDDIEEDYGNDKYAWILNKFCNGNFTFYELETIKECYLDLNSDYDKWFYEYLKEQAIDY
jgi:hypothetical protein